MLWQRAEGYVPGIKERNGEGLGLVKGWARSQVRNMTILMVKDSLGWARSQVMVKGWTRSLVRSMVKGWVRSLIRSIW